MAQCRICSSQRQGQINVWLLTGMPMARVAKACGLPVATVKNHKMLHIPYRPERRPKPITIAEQMDEIKFQLARLRCLAEAGENVTQPLKVLYAQRGMLELEMRAEGRLDPTNKKAMLAAPAMDSDLRVTFVNGRPKTVPIEKAS
jgi:hypothetical protein